MLALTCRAPVSIQERGGALQSTVPRWQGAKGHQGADESWRGGQSSLQESGKWIPSGEPHSLHAPHPSTFRTGHIRGNFRPWKISPKKFIDFLIPSVIEHLIAVPRLSPLRNNFSSRSCKEGEHVNWNYYTRGEPGYEARLRCIRV